MGGFPWLLPGLTLFDTLGQFLIPIIGVYGLSFIIYFLSAFTALSFIYKQSVYFFQQFCAFSIFLPQSNTNQKYSGESLKVGIIQPSLDPFKKFKQEETKNIEQTLLDLSTKHMNEDLIIWPESPFPYLNSSPEMRSFLIKLGNTPVIISGAWEYQNNELF